MSEQSMNALARATEVRYERADIRAWVREPAHTHESNLRLAAILDGPVTAGLKNLMIEDFLKWGWNSIPSRRRAACKLAGCHETRTIGQLTERQRTIIAKALRLPAFDLAQARDLHEFEAIHGAAA